MNGREVADLSALIALAPSDEESARLWSDLGRLAAHVLPDGWTLVGGLMVQLHAYEAGETSVRATTDIDILGDARQGACRNGVSPCRHGHAAGPAAR